MAGDQETSSFGDSIEEQLDALLQSFAERIRRGERPSITDYIKEYPDLADKIQEFLPTLAFVEDVQRDDVGSGQAAAVSTCPR